MFSFLLFIFILERERARAGKRDPGKETGRERVFLIDKNMVKTPSKLGIYF